MPSWTDLERRADGVTDLAGTPLDAGVRDVVVGLWAHGIETYVSCEGHLFEPRDEPFDPAWSPFAHPLVGIWAPPPDPHPLDLEPEVEHADPALREQARRWRLENYRMLARLVGLLERFYEARRSPFHARLQVSPTEREWGACELHSAGALATRLLARAQQAARLAEYQAEMSAFARFLRATDA